MFRQSLLATALATSVSLPTIALAGPDVTVEPLTGQVVAAAAARDCGGYRISIESVIEQLYGKDARAAYEHDHDLEPAKFADQLAGVRKWMADRFNEIAPPGKTYSYWTYAAVRPTRDGSSKLEVDMPSTVSVGFPEDFCGGRNAKFKRDLGGILLCPVDAFHPAPYATPLLAAAGTRQMQFAMPAGVDASSAVGGDAGDRSVILETEGVVEGCNIQDALRSAIPRAWTTRIYLNGSPQLVSGGGIETYWPTTVRIYGVQRGMLNTRGFQYFRNYSNEWTAEKLIEDKSFEKVAGALLATFNYPPPNITSAPGSPDAQVSRPLTN